MIRPAASALPRPDPRHPRGNERRCDDALVRQRGTNCAGCAHHGCVAQQGSGCKEWSLASVPVLRAAQVINTVDCPVDNYSSVIRMTRSFPLPELGHQFSHGRTRSPNDPGQTAMVPLYFLAPQAAWCGKPMRRTGKWHSRPAAQFLFEWGRRNDCGELVINTVYKPVDNYTGVVRVWRAPAMQAPNSEAERSLKVGN